MNQKSIEQTACILVSNGDFENTHWNYVYHMFFYDFVYGLPLATRMYKILVVCELHAARKYNLSNFP